MELDKPKIIKKARAIGEGMSLAHGWEKERCCPFYAVGVVAALASCGVKACIQAGTVMWPRLTEEQDKAEGCKGSTHFSYDWLHADPLYVEMCLARGQMPELHVWAAIPSTKEIIDATICFQEQNCKTLAGLDWPGPKLPDYIWMDEQHWLNGCVYIACPEAMKIVFNLLRNVREGRTLRGR